MGSRMADTPELKQRRAATDANLAAFLVVAFDAARPLDFVPKRWPLQGVREVIVGRGNAADSGPDADGRLMLYLDDKWASSRHARIFLGAGGDQWGVED